MVEREICTPCNLPFKTKLIWSTHSLASRELLAVNCREKSPSQICTLFSLQIISPHCNNVSMALNNQNGLQYECVLTNLVRSSSRSIQLKAKVFLVIFTQIGYHFCTIAIDIKRSFLLFVWKDKISDSKHNLSITYYVIT